ncbi:uncharacterized protein HD556DRAFT_1539567 [Suillus plorans]|uniref:CHAT domain-containing protein n=1 Tax=Suillus plorans TaxID=116603 RepID=A0A9P7AC63_9AGAM|nr:uncharacterized protein HD556DRAFT_1539567 [Suillus plorans]KAG1786427.1 hypothetical protein HD556DRAFT_1539567 [Suillus plorans]
MLLVPSGDTNVAVLLPTYGQFIGCFHSFESRGCEVRFDVKGGVGGDACHYKRYCESKGILRVRIHVAAGLQFAGVKSVVGTLWKVNDDTVQRLVEAFYKNICGDGTMNSKRAARALHQAVRSLAEDKVNPIPLDQRIVFMHIGV